MANLRSLSTLAQATHGVRSNPMHVGSVEIESNLVLEQGRQRSSNETTGSSSHNSGKRNQNSAAIDAANQIILL